MAKTPSSSKAVGLRHGFRSGLEERIADQLKAASVEVRYECPDSVIRYVKPERPSRYTPDFVLPNGIIIESKGYFTLADRQKHLLIKDQFPSLDIRFVFSRSSNKISKNSRTTYARWCEKFGFKWADKLIPQEWLDE